VHFAAESGRADADKGFLVAGVRADAGAERGRASPSSPPRRIRAPAARRDPPAVLRPRASRRSLSAFALLDGTRFSTFLHRRALPRSHGLPSSRPISYPGGTLADSSLAGMAALCLT
jgi:hypothetical protein